MKIKESEPVLVPIPRLFMITLYVATPFRFKSNPYLQGFNGIDQCSRHINLLRGTVHEQPVDIARNILVNDFLSKTEDNQEAWLLFVDDDVLLPTDTLDLFLRDLKDNVSRILYGEYCLKKRSYESAHTKNPDGSMSTVATGLMFIHRSVFVELLETRTVGFGVQEKNNPYRWFIFQEGKEAGEDHYFTCLCSKIGVESKSISGLEGIHIDFVNRAAFGSLDVVRNGKIRHDKAYLYALDKTLSPVYNDLVETYIEITPHTFPSTKSKQKIAVLTPRRYKTSPILSPIFLNKGRNEFNIDLLTTSEIPRDKARNQLVELALEDGADYIFFLDDDIIVDWDSLKILLDAYEDIVGLNYGLKKPYYESAHLMCDPSSRENEVYQYSIPTESRGKTEVKRVIGLGATLIKAKVFHSLSHPWFQEHTDDNMDKEFLKLDDSKSISYTDDAFFTNLCVGAGYKPKVLADVHAGHVDFSCFKVYGHPDIVDNKKAKLLDLNNIHWALSEGFHRELVC